MILQGFVSQVWSSFWLYWASAYCLSCNFTAVVRSHCSHSVVKPHRALLSEQQTAHRHSYKPARERCSWALVWNKSREKEKRQFLTNRFATMVKTAGQFCSQLFCCPLVVKIIIYQLQADVQYIVVLCQFSKTCLCSCFCFWHIWLYMLFSNIVPLMLLISNRTVLLHQSSGYERRAQLQQSAWPESGVSQRSLTLFGNHLPRGTHLNYHIIAIHH